MGALVNLSTKLSTESRPVIETYSVHLATELTASKPGDVPKGTPKAEHPFVI